MSLKYILLMSKWEEDFAWNRVKHELQNRMNLAKAPDLNGILFLIGIQELGRWGEEFTKEQKQDLMHIAICRLLETDGYYEFVGRDGDGWPHYKLAKRIPEKGLENQEELIKEKIIEYFAEWEKPVGK